MYLIREPKSPVAFYFERLKVLGIGQEYLDIFSNRTTDWYTKGVRNMYDILFDRVMSSKISPSEKGEMERWYTFNRQILGSAPTTEINEELEEMLLRFNLI